jgi:hypothetical protein
MKKRQTPAWISIILCLFVLAACSSDGGDSAEPTEPATEIAQGGETAVPPTKEPEPTDHPPTETAVSPTASPLPTRTPAPTPTIDYQPLFPIGSTADWTASSDAIGIEGAVEFISATQLRIRDFVFLAAEAPGVDIRLGLDRNFDNGVAVSLKDITGDIYDGGSLTLTIPDEAFDGRQFNSIAVVCYDNGDIFDWALIEAPVE